jgi:hypothetical protein
MGGHRRRCLHFPTKQYRCVFHLLCLTTPAHLRFSQINLFLPISHLLSGQLSDISSPTSSISPAFRRFPSLSGWQASRKATWRRSCDGLASRRVKFVLSLLCPFCRLTRLLRQDDLIDYTNRPRRTINEVLYEFRAATIPPEYIFDLLPPIRPRGFSNSSSPAVRPPLSLIAV